MTDLERGPLDGGTFTSPPGTVAVIFLLQAPDGEVTAHRYVKQGVQMNEAGMSDVLHQLANPYRDPAPIPDRCTTNCASRVRNAACDCPRGER